MNQEQLSSEMDALLGLRRKVRSMQGEGSGFDGIMVSIDSAIVEESRRMKGVTAPVEPFPFEPAPATRHPKRQSADDELDEILQWDRERNARPETPAEPGGVAQSLAAEIEERCEAMTAAIEERIRNLTRKQQRTQEAKDVRFAIHNLVDSLKETLETTDDPEVCRQSGRILAAMARSAWVPVWALGGKA